MAHPGKDMPSASMPHAKVLALNIPAQVPAPGQAQSSSSFNSSSDISPRTVFPTASKTSIKSTLFPLKFPGSIGPPVRTIVGISSSPAAIKWPGTISSHDGIRTMPSNACP